MTNRERIQAMSNQELALFLLHVNMAYAQDCMIYLDECHNDGDCLTCFAKYLDSEVKTMGGIGNERD